MSQETLERELARRAEDVHGAPLSFADVRGKAVSIRRRRRASVAGAVAAVVALVVIVPTALTGGNGPGEDAPEPAPPVPGHTAVLHDGTLTLPDGGTVPIDVNEDGVQQIGLLQDGRLVVASSDPYGILVFNPDGSLQEQYPALVNALTMSPTDDAVAWVGGADDSDRGVRVLASGDAEPTVLPGIPALGEYPGFVSAVLAPARVLVDGGDGTDEVLTPDGPEPSGLDEGVRVTDVSPDGELWAVDLAPGRNEQSGCAALYDPTTSEVVAENCDTSGLQFSPDGQHVLGVRGDNGMWGDVRVLDLDLQTVGAVELGQGAIIKEVAWADSDHLFVVSAPLDGETGPWSLLEQPIDGDARVVAGPVDGPNAEYPSVFRLSQ